MTLNSLDHLLIVLEKQPHWDEYRRYVEICQAWETIITEKIAPHTKPLFIQRDVLWVATSSAAWSQQLSFQGHSLLKKLNNQISSSPLLKIRFSSGQWDQNQPCDQDLPQETNLSFFSYPHGKKPLAKTSRKPTQTPEEAFKQWTQVVQEHLQSLPLCPQCQCPTPLVELERWSKCSLCITQHWQTKSQVPSE
jgi:predicted nucleic acid-binding Zn ribbon protein